MKILEIAKKMHIRHLLIASGIYVVALPIIILIISMSAGIIYLDGSYDENIFILTILATALVSWVCYLIFFGSQRRIANKAPSAEYLGLRERIVVGVIASVIAAAVLISLCFFWISPYGEDTSLLRLYFVDYTLVFLCIFVVSNFVNFIVFKPRY